MMFFYTSLSVLAALLILLPGIAVVHAADGITTLDPVTVTGVATDRLSGKGQLSSAQLESLPRNDGSLNGLLLVLPGVQAGEMSNTSLQGGEILPPNLSISGGRFYDNNFMIDGVGNNSLLDPAGDNPEHVQNIPGHPQEMFIDPGLIDEINVYRYNVPAEYGGFTGGVVDAATRNPAKTFAGKVDLRTTRAGWTRFHLADEYKDTFKDSNSVEQQPRFSKYHGGVELDLPLADDMALLVSCRNLQSRIPLRHFGETQDQNRDQKNYFAKYVYDLSDRTVVKLTFVQTPFEEERFREAKVGSEIKGSWYTIDRNGYRLSGELSHRFDLGKLEVLGGYRNSENVRQAPAHYFIWNTRPANWTGDWDKDWGAVKFSHEGGYGDLESTQESETLAVNFTAEPVRTGPVSHEVKFGYGFERTTGTFDRRDLTYAYSAATTDARIVCGDNPLDCIDGQQFLWFRSVYEPDSINETIDQHSLYLQDTLEFKRLTLRPGYRITRDNFMENIDRDLRLAATFDLFGSGDTLVVGGVNRYHGRSLLTYKLSEAKKPYYTERRTKKTDGSHTLNDWVLATQNKSVTKYSELDTPYSDEWNVGIDQALRGGRLRVDYLERRNKDEFASETSDKDGEGYTYFTLNNNGRTLHEAVTLAWDRAWSRHYLNVNATWQKTESSHNDYTLALAEDDLLDQIYYHGRLMKRIDLPRDDYNRGYVGNLIYTVNLPYGFTFTNHTRYRSGYQVMEDSGDDQEGPDGVMLPVYVKEKQPESWIFNWKLDWRRNLYRRQGIGLSLEINNVFNQKVPAGAAEEIQTYELGRQFWAGMEYYF
ncbi:MAG: TonB-dependent receptor [Trichloromonas sp.]|jgi:hypothetical protein|nr:TonB-dependent receptor [Trichloromonas sp.]